MFGLTSALPGQVRLDTTGPETKALLENFEKYWSSPERAGFDCTFERFGPVLGYGLRVWTGYSAFIPVSQFDVSKPHRVAVVFDVTLESKAIPSGQDGGRKQSTVFYQQQNLPAPPADQRNLKKAGWTLGGGFYLGPGEYRVRWLLVDDGGRRIRKSWRLSVKGGKTPIPTPPGTAESLDADRWRGFDGSAGGARARILMHAAPVWPRRHVTRLSPWDRQVLLSSLVSLLRTGGFGSASVTVFDVERRRVLFREERFGPRSLRELRGQLAQADYATISYQTLTGGPTVHDFLEGVLWEEMRSAGKDELLVFMGPSWRMSPKSPPVPARLREAVPKTYFMSFGPATIPPQDSVTALAKGLRGRILAIHRPEDLPKAIRAIAERD